ncbi:hypothetical protein M8998_04730 [Sphingobacterium sp. lm-10]|uniref:AfsR/SARP family transcriptional regulator n=1 Tax=Sphingobacterium sp. lm-10 TaxID=2944904 RepID=UPI0020215A5A|nr:hypothetical protein [Sphingobacterium sp. lm-10]MCL7987243.1 hypothetical protein [Sphingobacterium sp. lm-10]
MAQGIQLTGSNHPIEQRSSVRLFEQNHPNFRGIVKINFDLHIRDDGTAGYLIRLKNNAQHPTYNLYFDKEDNEAVFRFNEEGKSGLIRLAISMDKLKKQRWLAIQMTYDLREGNISLSLGEFATQSVRAPRLDSYSPVVIFGKSDYLIDVPSFSLRELVITDEQRKLVFPMKESTGIVIHDESGIPRGKVSNVTWLFNNAYHWHRSDAIYSNRKSGSEYDEKKQLAYYFNSDSLYIHHLREGFTEAIRFANACPVLIKLGNSFIDSTENRLYVYETFYEHPYEGPTVASLGLSDYTWRVESSQYLGNELNHHGALYLTNQRTLFVFGGFGNMLYNNNLMRYEIANSTWTTPQNISNDQILPRYFTSMGYGKATKKVYLFGGMGNESGQHIVGRKYFYDLYEMDPTSASTKKLWQLDWQEPHFVPARGLVIPDDNWIYMLGYPEHVSRSLIQLRRFSLKDGSYEKLGDSIPIYSDKISTRAKLYHDKNLQKLIALVQESDDDIRSKLSVYELDFPAISQTKLHAFPNGSHGNRAWWIGLSAAFIIAGAVVVYRRQIGKQPTLITGTIQPKAPKPEVVEEGLLKPTGWKHPDKNSIFLFGDFTVLDRRGNDISHLFSTRLRQVFCLILVHSDAAGISSTLLSYLIWPDKPKDKVKTSRGVTINNLRKALSTVEGIEIVYENGHYRVAITSPCYCDYSVLRAQLAKNKDLIAEDINLLIRRGSFLLGSDDPLFDEAKSKLEDELISNLHKSIVELEKQQNWTLLFAAADLLIALDPVHEMGLKKGLKALQMLNLIQQTNRFYARFTANYQQLLGEEYPHTLQQVLTL